MKITHKTSSGDQDGRVGGHQAHLLPRTHQNYVYMQSNFHWKPTRDWQKDSTTTKSVNKRSIQSWVGREEKLSDQDPYPEEGTQKRRGILQMWRSSLESEQFKSHIGHPSPDKRKTHPLGWFENQWDLEEAYDYRGCSVRSSIRLSEKNFNSASEEHAYTCLLPAKRGSRLKLSGTLAGFLQLPHHAPRPCQASVPAIKTKCWGDKTLIF